MHIEKHETKCITIGPRSFYSTYFIYLKMKKLKKKKIILSTAIVLWYNIQGTGGHMYILY